MFRCIARTKQMGAEEGGARESGTPSRKKGIKNLTIQVLNPTSSLTHNELSLPDYKNYLISFTKVLSCTRLKLNVETHGQKF